jgi:hypothetical protein
MQEMHKGKGLTRRTALIGFAGLAGAGLAGRSALAAVAADPAKLKPGQFIWTPEAAPRGPLSIVVSIKSQRLYAHRNGVKVAVSTVSTGKKGHDTPTGVFTVLQKDKDHVSNIYEDAEMPFMNRLTWSGIALHAGKLPGYPASHGCVRLPYKFAELLYGITRIGTPVVIAGSYTDPESVSHPGVFGGLYDRAEFADIADTKRKELASSDDSAPKPATSVLISTKDRKIIVMQNGDVVAEGSVAISDPGKPFKSNVFILSGTDNAARGLRWEAIGYDDGDGALLPDASTIERIHGGPDVVAAIRERMVPGMVLVITDDSITRETQSGKDFVVMTTAAADDEPPQK